MEIRSTSTRIRQVGQKSENHRGTSPKSTVEVSVGIHPTFQASFPSPGVVGKTDLNLHLAETLDRFIHREQSFFKAQLNLELCGENSPSISNKPRYYSTRTWTSSTPPLHPLNSPPPPLNGNPKHFDENLTGWAEIRKSRRNFAEKH
ncbi:hypothetical protein CDAR_254171 [Caerostris darwini]|uniref:Uncharacterized protein n=1 Tax=Caerostris darwini TaxID=1538125 RepID=A0AAV4TX53_9ARAC|nr:hypothetical protein CDAR_254171 [Caerostris darwini]